MSRKFGAIVLAIVGLEFVSVANAGTEVIRDYGNQGPAYNYAPPPPPRPVYYPPPPVGVYFYPRYPFYGPRFGVYRAHRFYARRPYYWHGH